MLFQYGNFTCNFKINILDVYIRQVINYYNISVGMYGI